MLFGGQPLTKTFFWFITQSCQPLRMSAGMLRREGVLSRKKDRPVCRSMQLVKSIQLCCWPDSFHSSKSVLRAHISTRIYTGCGLISCRVQAISHHPKYNFSFLILTLQNSTCSLLSFSAFKIKGGSQLPVWREMLISKQGVCPR